VLPSSQQAFSEMHFETKISLTLSQAMLIVTRHTEGHVSHDIEPGHVNCNKTHERAMCHVRPCTTVAACFNFIFYHFAPSWYGHLNPMHAIAVLEIDEFSYVAVVLVIRENTLHCLLQGLIDHFSIKFSQAIGC
jgi:hypothetical protein